MHPRPHKEDVHAHGVNFGLNEELIAASRVEALEILFDLRHEFLILVELSPDTVVRCGERVVQIEVVVFALNSATGTGIGQ